MHLTHALYIVDFQMHKMQKYKARHTCSTIGANHAGQSQLWKVMVAVADVAAVAGGLVIVVMVVLVATC